MTSRTTEGADEMWPKASKLGRGYNIVSLRDYSTAVVWWPFGSATLDGSVSLEPFFFRSLDCRDDNSAAEVMVGPQHRS